MKIILSRLKYKRAYGIVKLGHNLSNSVIYDYLGIKKLIIASSFCSINIILSSTALKSSLTDLTSFLTVLTSALTSSITNLISSFTPLISAWT